MKLIKIHCEVTSD